MRLKKILSLSILSLGLLGLSACGGSGATTTTTTQTPEPSKTTSIPSTSTKTYSEVVEFTASYLSEGIKAAEKKDKFGLGLDLNLDLSFGSSSDAFGLKLNSKNKAYGNLNKPGLNDKLFDKATLNIDSTNALEFVNAPKALLDILKISDNKLDLNLNATYANKNIYVNSNILKDKHSANLEDVVKNANESTVKIVFEALSLISNFSSYDIDGAILAPTIESFKPQIETYFNMFNVTKTDTDNSYLLKGGLDLATLGKINLEVDLAKTGYKLNKVTVKAENLNIASILSSFLSLNVNLGILPMPKINSANIELKPIEYQEIVVPTGAELESYKVFDYKKIGEYVDLVKNIISQKDSKEFDISLNYGYTKVSGSTTYKNEYGLSGKLGILDDGFNLALDLAFKVNKEYLGKYALSNAVLDSDNNVVGNISIVLDKKDNKLVLKTTPNNLNDKLTEDAIAKLTRFIELDLTLDEDKLATVINKLKEILGLTGAIPSSITLTDEADHSPQIKLDTLYYSLLDLLKFEKLTIDGTNNTEYLFKVTASSIENLKKALNPDYVVKDLGDKALKLEFVFDENNKVVSEKIDAKDILNAYFSNYTEGATGDYKLWTKCDLSITPKETTDITHITYTDTDIKKKVTLSQLLDKVITLENKVIELKPKALQAYELLKPLISNITKIQADLKVELEEQYDSESEIQKQVEVNAQVNLKDTKELNLGVKLSGSDLAKINMQDGYLYTLINFFGTSKTKKALGDGGFNLKDNMMYIKMVAALVAPRVGSKVFDYHLEEALINIDAIPSILEDLINTANLKETKNEAGVVTKYELSLDAKAVEELLEFLNASPIEIAEGSKVTLTLNLTESKLQALVLDYSAVETPLLKRLTITFNEYKGVTKLTEEEAQTYTLKQ